MSRHTINEHTSPAEAYDLGYEDGVAEVPERECDCESTGLVLPDPGSGEMATMVARLAEVLSTSLYGERLRDLPRDGQFDTEDAARAVIDHLAGER